MGDIVDITGVVGSAAGVTVIEPGSEYTGMFPPLGLTETIDVNNTGFRFDISETVGGVLFTGDIIQIDKLDFVTNPLNGLITGVNLIAGPPGYIDTITFSDGPGIDSGRVTVTFLNKSAAFMGSIFFEFEIVPEPGTMVLAVAGLAVFARRSRRFR